MVCWIRRCCWWTKYSFAKQKLCLVNEPSTRWMTKISLMSLVWIDYRCIDGIDDDHNLFIDCSFQETNVEEVTRKLHCDRENGNHTDRSCYRNSSSISYYGLYGCVNEMSGLFMETLRDIDHGLVIVELCCVRHTT